MAIRSLTIRIEDQLLDKLHVVADYEARSVNGQVLILIRDCIKRFEDEHGEIETSRNSQKARPKWVAFVDT